MKEVYTLMDLVSREVLDAGADKPARLAVIGWPVAHSASPRMHQAALDAHALDVRYIRLEVEPGQVSIAFDRMRALGFIGCNVTVPHKLEAMGNCAEVHPDAMLLGSVNTVRFDQDATRGFNTDGPGFACAIEGDFGAPLARFKVAIMGAGGGVGQAIATQCVLLGVEKLVLVNRSFGKLRPLADRLHAIGRTPEIVALALGDESLAAQLAGCDLIVNASSIGLHPGDEMLLPAACLQPRHCVYDTIYQPPVTALLRVAGGLGCRTANGCSMLLHQGALAFQHWFPEAWPLDVMRVALAQRV